MAVQALFLLFVFLTALIVAVRHRKRVLSPPLPPGPPSDPILGHLRIFPRSNQDDVLHQWSKVYGDVMYLTILGKPIIVLSSEQAAVDLLDKRSANYSDRPSFPVFDLFGWGDVLAFARYGPAFHQQRKLLQQPFTRPGCVMFQGIQVYQTHELLKHLLQNPMNFELHLRRFTAAVIMEIAYGHKVVSDDDLYVQLAQEVNDSVAVMGGAAILDLLPFLKYLPAWFPGAWFIRKARDTKPILNRMEIAPFEEVRREMAAGTAQPSFTSMHLEELERNGPASETDLSMLRTAAFHMWTAGEETSWATMVTFILLMVQHPEAQKRAQREIDQVIGSDRLPDFSDRDSLPYVESLLQECRRWHPIVPLGVPHRVMEDDIYNGMFIPKDTMIIANPKALTLDERVYKDPHVFRPERFLGEKPEPHPTSAFFGYGRRICAGRHLADASVWIVASNILAAFDISKAKDEHGNEIDPVVVYTSGLTSHPEPFLCSISPRNAQTKRLVEGL